ncbi:hypothetical protein QR680_005063 [Steinernema hermaphroditum]|uniref:N-acetyltransferase domain-containing protein n=1 Tax=Steinernema hermaphroditum TaxID=289476 RepID=A0AA39HQQ8_9BILA|nr:hypothetical protein QR680_005063 [Steinernema hermaphroditum]
MEDIEFLDNPSQDDWILCVDLSYNHDHWALNYNDWPAWKSAFPDGANVYYAKTKSSKEVVGFCTSSTAKSLDGQDELSSIGCFFVHPDYRSLGIGSKLFESVIRPKREAKKNMTIVAVIDMSAKYDKRHGFDKYCEFEYESYLIPMDTMDLEVLEVESKRYTEGLDKKGIEVLDVSEVLDEKILEFDRKIVKFDRTKYVPTWIRRADNYSKVAVEKSTGDVVGYASLRNGRGEQLMFSPIFADNEEIAFGLVLSTIRASSKHQQLHLGTHRKTLKWRLQSEGISP